MTVISVPTAPEDGTIPILGFTVNEVKPALKDASVANTVFEPTDEDSTGNVVVKVPAILVVTTLLVTPWNFTIVEELFAKPLPVTVIDVPTGPEFVLRETVD